MATKFIVYKENGKKDHIANFKIWCGEAFEKVKKAASKTWEWVKENKEDLAVIAPIAIGVAAKISSSLKGSATDRRQRRVDYTYYDPSTGAHWRLRRPLNNAEQMELITRKRNGERAEYILSEMGLLAY